MKAFMDKEFMLQSPTAQHLYHAYAEDMPICDYHCHIPPREIYENRRFDNIAQVWLGGRNPDGTKVEQKYSISPLKCLQSVILKSEVSIMQCKGSTKSTVSGRFKIIVAEISGVICGVKIQVAAAANMK